MPGIRGFLERQILLLHQSYLPPARNLLHHYSFVCLEGNDSLGWNFERHRTRDIDGRRSFLGQGLKASPKRCLSTSWSVYHSGTSSLYSNCLLKTCGCIWVLDVFVWVVF